MTIVDHDHVVCDSCGETKSVPPRHEDAVEFLRAANWHHGEGLTIGGKPYTSDMCPRCARPGLRGKTQPGVLTQQCLWED